MEKLKTPDFTPEALVALVTTLLGNIYILFGTGLSTALKGGITGTATTLILIAFLIHSAWIRSARTKLDPRAAVDAPAGEAYTAPD